MGDDRYDFSSPERLTNLLRRVPELRAVAAHFGGWRSWPRSLAHLQPEGVLYDTSSTLGMIDPGSLFCASLTKSAPTG